MAVRLVNGLFDPQTEQAAFVAGRTDAGALVSFVGYCRKRTAENSVDELFLDHHSPFTESEIARILGTVSTRYELLDALIIHRVGMMRPGDPIVLVAVLSPHRNQAFEAVRILMDYLKTDAPLWKKEIGPEGQRWIEPSDDDYARRAAAERDSSGRH